MPNELGCTWGSPSPNSAPAATSRSAGVKARVNSWYPALIWRNRAFISCIAHQKFVYLFPVEGISVSGINSTRWPFDLLPSRGGKKRKVGKAGGCPVRWKKSQAESKVGLWMETWLRSPGGTRAPGGRSAAACGQCLCQDVLRGQNS